MSPGVLSMVKTQAIQQCSIGRMTTERKYTTGRVVTVTAWLKCSDGTERFNETDF